MTHTIGGPHIVVGREAPEHVQHMATDINDALGRMNKAVNDVSAEIETVTDALDVRVEALETSQPFKCQLTLSGGSLLLSPKDGNRLVIDGSIRTLPDAGASLAASGLSIDTTYYIYAYMSGSDIALEASTTASATQTGTGLKVKTGDTSRSLVGMARVITGPSFADTITQRFVRSYYNRVPAYLANDFTANRATTGIPTTPTELNSEIRCEFICWDDDLITAHFNGRGASNGADDGFLASVFDAGLTNSTYRISFFGTTSIALANTTTIVGLSEGYHYGTVAVWTGGLNNATIASASTLMIAVE